MSTAAPTSSPEGQRDHDRLHRRPQCRLVEHQVRALRGGPRRRAAVSRTGREHRACRRTLRPPTLSGATVAERRWAKGELDHHGATDRDPEARARAPGRPAGARLRPSRRPRRHANSPRRSASMRASWPRSRSWCRWRRCTSRTISRPSRSSPRRRPASRRSPASTPRSIAPSRRSRRNSPCRASSRPPACAATASTACPTISSCRGWARSIRPCAKSRLVIAHLGNGASLCAVPRAAAWPAPWASPPSTA